MNIRELKKLTISALVLVMNNPSYDDDTRRNAEIEFRRRIVNLGYDINDFAHEELMIIMGRGFDFENYLVGPNPNMQLLMELYFRFHNQSDDEKTLLFSETHLCNDAYERNNFFTDICRLEIANIEKRMMDNDCTQGIIAAYNTLLERFLDARLRSAKSFANLDALLDHGVYSYGNNMSDDDKEKMESSPFLRAKYTLMERLSDKVMQSNMAQCYYGSRLVKKDSALLAKQKKGLYSQVKSEYKVDYNTEEMAFALKLTK